MLRRSWLALACIAGIAGCKDARGSAGAAASSDALPAPPLSGVAAAVSGTPADDDPPAPTDPAVVDLRGDVHPRPAATSGPRLAAIAMVTDVHKKPDPAATRIGSLRAGSIVAIEPEPQGTAGCPGGWRRIKPQGYVCLGPEATLDLDNPVARAARPPDLGEKLPYMYGIATRGGPVYARVPTEKDITEFEPHLAEHLAHWRRDEVSGATYGLELWLRGKTRPAPPALEALERRVTDDEIPWFLRDHHPVPNLSGLVKSDDLVKIGGFDRRNGVAFTDTFLYEGRRYGVSTDLRVLPTDRFRPIRGSDFHGVEIGKDVDFPFALVRRQEAKKWRLEGKKLVEAGDLPWRSAVALTGKQKIADGVLYYETKDGFYVDDRHAGRIDPAKHMPAWGKHGEKWIDINITKQVLVAYEGTKAVYATLVSSGEAGLGDPETTKATRRGIFRIHTKWVAVTMDSDVVGEEFELRDVPYVQYFEEGYALHGAYWHDKFGQPKSHGCVNLSPEDARRLFWWTEPQLPTGWHSVARPLTGTVVFIHP